MQTLPRPSGQTSEAPSSGRMGDARSLRSQAALRQALVGLIEEKALYSITMRDIALAAGVSYPTLFKHYASREALFEEIARKEITGFQEHVFLLGPAAPPWRPGEQICCYVLERRRLWRTLFTTGAAEAMRSEFLRHARELADSRTDLSLGAPTEVVSGVIASGIFEILSWWLARDATHPADEVARMLESLVLEPALNQPPGFFAAGSAQR